MFLLNYDTRANFLTICDADYFPEVRSPQLGIPTAPPNPSSFAVVFFNSLSTWCCRDITWGFCYPAGLELISLTSLFTSVITLITFLLKNINSTTLFCLLLACPVYKVEKNRNEALFYSEMSFSAPLLCAVSFTCIFTLWLIFFPRCLNITLYLLYTSCLNITWTKKVCYHNLCMYISHKIVRFILPVAESLKKCHLLQGSWWLQTFFLKV